MADQRIKLNINTVPTPEARADRAHDRAIAIGIATLLDEHRPDWKHHASARSYGSELDIHVTAIQRHTTVTATLTRAAETRGASGSRNEAQAP